MNGREKGVTIAPDFERTMRLYQNLLKTALSAQSADLVEYHRAQFAPPFREGVDSLRFIATRAFLFKFEKYLDGLNLKLSPTAFNSNHLTLADFFGLKTPKTAQICKIGLKTNIYIYSTSDTIKTARNAHRALDNFAFLEIHGLSQYAKDGSPLPLTDAVRAIILYLLRYCDHSKERNALRLASFDYALDYRSHAKISKEFAISKAEYLRHMDAQFVEKGTGLYIQREYKPHGKAEALAGILQKITIYDKSAKNELKKPIIRFELQFFTDRREPGF